MKLLLISTDLDDIRRSYRLGVFSGLASNPSLVAAAGLPSCRMVEEVLKLVPDPVFVQVSGLTTSDMLEEAQRLIDIAPQRVIIKVPVTANGVEAIHALVSGGATVAATAIYAANEALVAARAGAQYLAPYVGRIHDMGGDGSQVLADILEFVRTYELRVHVIAASIRTPEEMMSAWKLRADYAALESSVIRRICESPASEATARAFHDDYQARFPEPAAPHDRHRKDGNRPQ
jgi:transaldolase